MTMKFGCIVADPPWQYKGQVAVGCGGKGGDGFKTDGQKYVQVGADNIYPTMPLEDIIALDVKSLALPDSHLYLWTTNAFLADGSAAKVAVAWGFKPITIITWTKEKKNQEGEASMKTGFHFRGATEHIVFCTRGRTPQKGLPRPTSFYHPRLPHSAKPQLFFDLAVEKSPGPYLEMFARTARDGWERWGNEVESTHLITRADETLSSDREPNEV
jgi:N6-adenosine-specific RNA methylase IME4